MIRSRVLLRPSSQILVATAVIALVFVLSFVHDQWTRQHEAIARAERDARNAASLIAEHTARSFEAIEEVLRAVARVHRDVRSGSIPRDPALVHQLLKAIHGTSSLYLGAGWVDAQGNVVATSRFATPPPINIADQEHFRLQRDGNAGGLLISKTVRSVFDRQLLLNTSTRLANPDGSFAGIAAVSVNVAHLAQIYERIDLGPSAVMTVFRTDGALLVRTPNNLDWIGADFKDRPLFRHHLPRAESGTFHATAPLDGVEGIVSYARVPDLPLVIAATLSRDDALAAFDSQLRVSAGRLAATLLVLGLGAWLLVVQMRRRERLELDLRTNETKFRDFAAASGDWFWETDEQHRFIWMSNSVEARTGVPPAWHYGKSRVEMAAPEGVSSDIWADHKRTLEAHLPFRDFEYVRRGPSGDRWLRSSGVPIFDESGRFRGYRGSGSDVTDLRSAERLLRDAVEVIPGRFMLFDSDDRLVYANHSEPQPLPGAELAQIGDTFESILRRTIAAGLIPEAAADPEAWIAERLRRHRAAAGSTVMRRSNRVLEVIERPTHDGGIMLLRFDVTERERLAEAAHAAREAADAANNAKSEFLSRMSHELRTPLNAILGFAQMLRLNRQRNLTAEQQEFADFIGKGGQHLLNLVNEVLDLSGIEAGRMKLSLEPVSADDILRNALDTMRPVAAKAGIRLDSLPAVAIGDVRSDPQRLRQVLLNLLSNAIKYNRPHGTVSVSVTDMGGQRIRISVSDTGPGIPPHAETELFTPFQRLGAEFTAIEGTGIGLALSKRLIEAMDGQIGYTTAPGRGTTFWIELPANAQAAAPSAPSSAADVAPRAVTGGYSLLYVEDNPASLRLMEHLLADLPNVAMLAAPTGPLGLDLAIAHRPDVIVLDLNLPGLSGFDILARLKTVAETRDIPVIALSAAAMPNDIKRGIAAGFFRYLTKPLEVNLLLETIDAALAAARARSVGGRRSAPAHPSPIGEAGADVRSATQASR